MEHTGNRDLVQSAAEEDVPEAKSPNGAASHDCVPAVNEFNRDKVGFWCFVLK